PDIQETEKRFRTHLNTGWCSGVMFNVLVHRKFAQPIEYDAMLWNIESMLFIEYKDSLNAYRKMSAKRAQQVSDSSRNIARRFGFDKYTYLLVVGDLPEETRKGDIVAIPLERLSDYEPDFQSTRPELDYVHKLIAQYEREENPVEVARDRVIRELCVIRDMIEQLR
ncbi:MAG: hypothetical protein J7J03_02285, partial [Methanosarcinales archaeon]|nr:hypothetical protein [Methanosarcinales archaeon]